MSLTEVPLDGHPPSFGRRRTGPGAIRRPVLDADAFGVLYAQHRDALFRYCVAKTGDRERAEDIVQDVFAKAFAGREAFDVGRPFWPWLASIAARECIDSHRRRSYAESRLPELARRMSNEPVDSTFATVLRTSEERELARRIAKLPPRQRIALQLVALDQWSYADVAARLGYSVAMVKALVVRARRTLRAGGVGSLGALSGGIRSLRLRARRFVSHLQAAVAAVPAAGPCAAWQA
ncbi:MAG: sigma-70 family RNA polymerase sigma factor, partial [Actinomycetota bacterium]|nr:sigma-70 family RNA polymerase sigma factor [Actinomycetota bacterium]